MGQKQDSRLGRRHNRACHLSTARVLGLLAAALLVNFIAVYFFSRGQMQRASTLLQTDKAESAARAVESRVFNKLEGFYAAAMAPSLSRPAVGGRGLADLRLLKNDLAYEEVGILDTEGQQIPKFSENLLLLDFLRADRPVVVDQPGELVSADLSPLLWYGAVLILFGLVLAALASAWARAKLTKPINELREAVAIIGQGNFAHRITIGAGDPLGELGKAINQMADTVKNSQANLELKVEQRTAQVSALYQIASAVNRSLDLDRVLFDVVKRINDIFQFDKTEVYLFDSGRKELVSRAGFASNSDSSRQDQQVSQLNRWVAENGNAITFDDVQNDSRYAEITHDRSSQGAAFRFLAVFPIHVPGQCLGTLSLSGKGGRTLTDEERKLLTSMCEHIAVAVEKVNLFDQLTTRFRHLEALNTIGAAVSRSLNLGEVLDRAVDRIAKTLAFDAAWIDHFDARDGRANMKAFYGLGDDMAAGMGAGSPNAEINGKLIETGERILFEDIQNDELPRESSWEGRLLSQGFQSAAAFPIKTKQKVIGALYVANRSKRHLTAEDLQLIESIARQVGVATENATLFEEVNLKTKELAKSNQELLEATQAKTEFIAAMSHELRTPLNIIIGSSDLLRDGFFGALTDGEKDATDKIARNARVLLKMINDVLTLSRFDANRISVDISTVSIDEILQQARAIVEQINRDHRLEVRWGVDAGIPPLTTDPLKLEEILQNLISNAFKFTPSGYIDVRVVYRREEDRVEFTVADTGIGIATEDQGKIFNAFEQLRDAHTGHFNGVGLGLSIVRRYLELLNGRIAVESQPGRGTKFTFSIPRSLQFDS